MSCDYDVICTDCNQQLGLDGWNHMDNECRMFVRNADVIAMLYEAKKVAGVDLELSHWRGHVDWEWFLKHRGHQLRVVDEYGRYDDTCDERFDCESCGYMTSCKLTKGHDGGHRVSAMRVLCPAFGRMHGRRCTRTLGHPGMHVSEGCSWDDKDNAAP
jgi:hypothetical protein